MPGAFRPHSGHKAPATDGTAGMTAPFTRAVPAGGAAAMGHNR
jgi:hypothetical protein